MRVVVAAVLLAAGVADAAGPRPFFQVPGSCGEVWHASTSSEQSDSLDLTTRDHNLGNAGDGEVVRAAAAGTVTDMFTTSDGENRIYIDHGNGWSSHYMRVRDPLRTILLNKPVAQGQVIGYLGNTGNTSEPYIQFTQLADDSAVRNEFSCELVETHEADTNTWGMWGTSKAEKILSENCVGEQFTQWTEDGATYMLIYKPSVGTMKIVRVNPNGEGTTTTWTGSWSLHYTHMETYKIGSENYGVMYRASTGKVVFVKFQANGAGYEVTHTGIWGYGWTHILPFQDGEQPYLLVYNAVTGSAQFDYVNAGNVGSTKIYGETWEYGRTLLKTYMMDGVHYMLLYKGGEGTAKFLSISFFGEKLKPMWTSIKVEEWTAGWSHFAMFSDKGTPHMVAYNQESGGVKFLRILPNGGVITTYSSTWSKPYTHLTSFQLGTDGGLFLYKTGNGLAKTIHIESGAAAYNNVWSKWWDLGYN